MDEQITDEKEYHVKVLHRNAYDTEEQYKKDIVIWMDKEFHIVSFDDYDPAFMVFAKEK